MGAAKQYRFPEWLMKAPITANAKVVWCYLRHGMTGDGVCSAGLRTIAEDTAVTLPTAKRVVGELERVGLLLVGRRRQGQASQYFIPKNCAKVCKNLSQSGPVKEKPKTDPRVAEFIHWFFEAYQTAIGTKYLVHGAKDGKLVKALLQRVSGNGTDALATLKAASQAMLADEWARMRADIGMLSSGINRWMGLANAPEDTLNASIESQAAELRAQDDE